MRDVPIGGVLLPGFGFLPLPRTRPASPREAEFYVNAITCCAGRRADRRVWRIAETEAFRHRILVP